MCFGVLVAYLHLRETDWMNYTHTAPVPQMLDFSADGEMQVAFDTEYGEDEDREVTMFGVTFKVVALPDLLAVGCMHAHHDILATMTTTITSRHKHTRAHR